MVVEKGKPLLEHLKCFYWRRGRDSNLVFVLLLNNLLILQNARIAKNATIANARHV
jgi:hypothetical protein